MKVSIVKTGQSADQRSARSDVLPKHTVTCGTTRIESPVHPWSTYKILAVSDPDRRAAFFGRLHLYQDLVAAVNPGKMLS